jgi:hypothetical protein
VSTEWAGARWDFGDTATDTLPPEIEQGNGDNLCALAARANKFHSEAEAHTRSALVAAWDAGQALNAAKAQCPHGTWLGWLEANFKGSKTTAQGYMRLASNTQRIALLNSEQSLRAALKALCKTCDIEHEDSEPEDCDDEPTDLADEAPQSEPQQPNPSSITRDFETEIFNLQNCLAEMQEILRDEQFPKARNKIKNAHKDHLLDAKNDLRRVIEVVMGKEVIE